MRAAEEMDQADMELRGTIKKIWPIQAKKNLDLIVPPDDGKHKTDSQNQCRKPPPNWHTGIQYSQTTSTNTTGKKLSRD